MDFGNLDNYLSNVGLSKTVGYAASFENYHNGGVVQPGKIYYTDGTFAPSASVPDITIVGTPHDPMIKVAFGSPDNLFT